MLQKEKLENGYFAFDIEGTLMTLEKGLQPNVAKLFSKIFEVYKNPQFLFITGGNYKIANKLIKAINDEIGDKLKHATKDKRLNNTSVSYAISQLYNKNGECLNSTFINRYACDQICQAVSEIDNDALIFYCTREDNYYIDRGYKQDFSFFAQKAPNQKFIDNIIDNEELLNLEIITLDKDKNKKITQSLNQIASFDETNTELLKDANILPRYTDSEFEKAKTMSSAFTVTPGSHIQVSFGNKESAIRLNFLDNLQNVRYMGDGYNDITILALGKHNIIKDSIALGDIPEVLSCGALALPGINDFAIDYFVGLAQNQNSTCSLQINDEDFLIDVHKLTFKQDIEKINKTVIEMSKAKKVNEKNKY